MNIIDQLEKLGLNGRQAKVYLALLQLGTGTAIDIAKATRFKHPTVYDVLDVLKERALVTETFEGGRKLFSAEDPNRLRLAEDERRRTLEGLERGELAALRALLAMHFLLTGQWYQPAPPAAAEGLPAALRALYQAETGLARDCAGAAETLEDECLGQRLSVLSREAAERAKQVGSVVENSLTTRNNLLKW